MPIAVRYAREKARAERRGSTPYRQRVARGGELGLTPSQSVGKPHTGEQPASAVLSEAAWTTTFYAADPPRAVTVTTDRRTAQRAGRYMQLTRSLREERISPETFRDRVRRRPRIAGYRLLDDPRAVLALAETTSRDDLVFESGRSRPRRTRRAA
jgi:hypothetical protein